MKKYTKLTGTIFGENKERMKQFRFGLSVKQMFELFHNTDKIEIFEGLTNEIVINLKGEREIILERTKISNMVFGWDKYSHSNYLLYTKETLNNAKLETLKEEVNYIIEKINSIAVEKITNIKFEILEK